MPRAFLARAITIGLVAALAQAAPSLAAETFRAGTPSGRNFTFLPLRIGIEKGIFAKNGLDLEVTDFGGGAKLQQAFVAGGIDLAVSAGTDMAFIAKGASERAVAVAGRGTTLGIVVPFDSPAKTVDDLKHKQIGVTTAGSFTEWLMRRYMQQHHWAADAATLVPIGSDVANDVALLTTHRIDAVEAPAALGFQLELSKRGRLVLQHFDLGPEFIGQALYASNRIIHDDPDAVRRFVKAWFETIAWMRGHKDETVAITRSYTHYAPEVENREYDDVIKIFSPDGRFHPAGLKALGEAFVEMKLLDQAPDMSKLYTDAFLPTK
ncbi:MAG TPA: ABC transporter substrate-binding protein [Stellaceae bacterium]|nr:ABC transporter substrate-binding protein [Stellaceae bacterium]